MKEGNKVPFRLALRTEGEFWNAYFAEPDTLKNAILMGSIRLAIVEKFPDIKNQFMNLMKDVIYSAANISDLEESEPISAPEHERSGNA